MKISDIILNQGIERRFRGPRKPRLKQVGLHNRMKNLLDGEGNPINIRRFDSTKREQIQYLITYLLDVSWVHITISYNFKRIINNEKIA